MCLNAANEPLLHYNCLGALQRPKLGQALDRAAHSKPAHAEHEDVRLNPAAAKRESFAKIEEVERRREIWKLDDALSRLRPRNSFLKKFLPLRQTEHYFKVSNRSV